MTFISAITKLITVFRRKLESFFGKIFFGKPENGTTMFLKGPWTTPQKISLHHQHLSTSPLPINTFSGALKYLVQVPTASFPLERLNVAAAIITSFKFSYSRALN